MPATDWRRGDFLRQGLALAALAAAAEAAVAMALAKDSTEKGLGLCRALPCARGASATRKYYS